MEATRPEESEIVGNASPPPSPESAAASAADAEAVSAPNAEDLRAQLEACTQKLAEAEAKRDEYLDLARRIQADFANYRKRIERQRQQWQEEMLVAFLREFLGYFDDFRRALAEGDKNQEFASFYAGMRLVHDNLWKTMAKAGVECIDPQGAAFDPSWHEAIATVPLVEHPPQTVVEVMQQGYRLGNTIIRPARVVVAVAPPDAPANGDNNGKSSTSATN